MVREAGWFMVWVYIGFLVMGERVEFFWGGITLYGDIEYVQISVSNLKFMTHEKRERTI